MKILLVAVFLFSMFSYAEEKEYNAPQAPKLESSYITCIDPKIYTYTSSMYFRSVDCIEIKTIKANFTGLEFDQNIGDKKYSFFFEVFFIACEGKKMETGRNCGAFFDQKRQVER